MADFQNYAAVSMKLETKDEIYSAMVVYGLLTYKDGKVFIPNRELMAQFKKLLIIVKLNYLLLLIWYILQQGIITVSRERIKPEKDMWTLFFIRNEGKRMQLY